MKKGGLARRAGLLKQLRAENKNLILLDGGDTFFSKKDVPEIRADYVLAGMGTMGYDALNIGEGDLSLGKDFFIQKVQEHHIQPVSANIRIQDKNGKDMSAPYIIREYGGLRVAVTGITPRLFIDDKVQQDPGVRVEGAIAALKEILAVLKDKSDAVILLSHFGYDGTRQMLQFNDLPGVALVIAGHGRNLTEQPEKVDDVILVQNSMGGEYLAALKIVFDDQKKILSYRLENTPLTDEVDEDSYLRTRMDQFQIEKETRKEKDRISELEKVKRTELLKLTPEEFINKMKKENQALPNGKE